MKHAPNADDDLPIVDAHHHLWDLEGELRYPWLTNNEHSYMGENSALRRTYLPDEYKRDCALHNVIATVFVQCGAFHKAGGPEHLRPVGETEFVNGVAAMTASGVYGPVRACAGIVGTADCTIGDKIKETLEAHLVAGGGRFRGIRHSASSDPDPGVLGPLNRTPPGLYASDAFRSGYKHLADYGMSFDAWLLEPQLPDLIDLVSRHPDIPVILDHVGTPLGIASYEGRREERFPTWLANIRELAKRPNVSVKLGGLAMAFCNFPSFLADPPAPSTQLAAEWKPYLDACIEAFGPQRCMFESNFPVDKRGVSYAVLWNTFKRLASGASAAEKAALFRGTACRFYRLTLA